MRGAIERALKSAARVVGLRRDRAAAIRMYAERQALALIGPRRRRKNGRILCYHSVGQPQSGVNDVTSAQFRRQIEGALALGFHYVPARSIADTGGAPNELAITFDDAWTSVLTDAASILREFQIPWTVFVVSDWSSHKNPWAANNILHWQALERVQDWGGEIGSHSVSHPDFARLTPPEIEDELNISREEIKAKLGVSAVDFAIPYGQSMNWPPQAHEAARAAGYEFIYAQSELKRSPGTIGRTFVTQFDNDRLFMAALNGVFDSWEEWF
jgi:peptidoglycan/xylan/chitin deacetylase (PgdA/CDA1 family)